MATVPDWFDERGLFGVHQDFDRRDAQPDQGELTSRKNVDFLRKDFALHLAARDVHPRPRLRDRHADDLLRPVRRQRVWAGPRRGKDQKAREKLARLGLEGHLTVGNAAQTTFPDGSFDAVLSSDFHEHVSATDQVAVLRECRRVLKPVVG